MKKTLLTTSLLLVAVGAMAQNDKSKKVESKYLSLPAYDVSAIDPASIRVEFAMGDGKFGTEKLKDTKSKCVPKGGSLKDVIEITAYHYEIPYTQAESYIVAKSGDGTVVYAAKASEAGQSSIRFGYDEKMKQSMCEYWISDQLKKDFAKKGASFKNSEHNKYVNNTFNDAFETTKANVSLSYFTEEFDVYTAKGKVYNYDDLDKAQEKALAAYESIKKNGLNDNDLARLKEATEVWEKELGSLDMEDKKARISEKIGKGLHENCVYAYFYMFEFDKAKEHAEAFKKMFGNFSNNRTQAMDEIIKRVYFQKIAAEKNKAILGDIAGLHAKASGAKSQLVSNKLGADQVERLKSEYHGYLGSQAVAVNQELKKDEEEKIASGELNPYQKYYMPTMVGGEGILINMPPSAISGVPELTEFPKEICEFTDAKQVIILKNKIETIPADIAKMTNLEKLDLSGNQLKALPAEIGQLSNLKTLKLSNNPLESLPAELANCTNLKSLVIKGTKLSGDQISEIQRNLPDCKIKN